VDDAARIAGLGAIVLTGGKSARMGRPKEALPFAGEPLLARVVGRVARVARPIVVVAAAGQALPSLPEGVVVARDAAPNRGPLEGLAAGMAAIGRDAEVVFVATTDAPFVHAAFVRRLVALRSDGEGAPWDAVVPRVGGREQPLCALYATSVERELRALLAEDRLRAMGLAARVRTRFADEALLLADEALRAADPGLRAVRNVNTPEEYAKALAEVDERGG
jgi:molybdopterin-guanine dinucleotide biosynthesis protein A